MNCVCTRLPNSPHLQGLFLPISIAAHLFLTALTLQLRTALSAQPHFGALQNNLCSCRARSYGCARWLLSVTMLGHGSGVPSKITSSFAGQPADVPRSASSGEEPHGRKRGLQVSLSHRAHPKLLHDSMLCSAVLRGVLSACWEDTECSSSGQCGSRL